LPKTQVHLPQGQEVRLPIRSQKLALSDSATVAETATNPPAKPRKIRAAKRSFAQGAQRPDHPCHEGLRRQMHDLLAQTGGTPDSGKRQAVSDLWPTFAPHHLALIRSVSPWLGKPSQRR
jgi:hypothetical protein